MPGDDLDQLEQIGRMCTGAVPYTCLSYVATLPREMQKVIFFNIIIGILQIIYVTSEEN